MTVLPLHDFHAAASASFGAIREFELVAHYGAPEAEYHALGESAGVVDLSFRGRLALTGNDRQRFLNGQVTNNVKDLKPGQGCYAALLTPKGKMISDLFIYALEAELLLDFEPGYTPVLQERLEKFLIADDVQMFDVAPHYGLFSVQGPRAAELVDRFVPGIALPQREFELVQFQHVTFGEMVCVNHARLGTRGFDCFVPVTALELVADALDRAAKPLGARLCGWNSLEMRRIEAARPRFGQDMDETNLPPECGLEARAISYTKGCYTGQEVIARLRTYGQAAKTLRLLRLPASLKELPRRGDKLFCGEKEIGYVTSSLASPTLKSNLALGFVRREHNQIGSELSVHAADAQFPAQIIGLPFQSPFLAVDARSLDVPVPPP